MSNKPIRQAQGQRLKIGYVTSSLSSYDGWSRYSKGIIKSMAKIADVRAVLTRKNADNELDGVPVYKVLPKKDNSFNFKIQLNTFWNTLKYLRGCDAIHSMMEPYAPGAALAAKLIGAKFFLTFHGTYAIPPKDNDLKSFLKRNLMRMMYGLTAVSTTGAFRNVKWVEEVFPIGHCEVIPNASDPDDFYNQNLPREQFLLTVGGVKPRKGADITVRALALLKDEFPNLHYKITGETKSAPHFVAQVRKLAKENNIEDRVHFLGRVTDKELAKLYNQCSIFALVAQTRDGAFEGFPMVFYEAQACGAPILSTYGFGSEYVVKNGYNGELVPENDVEATAEAIRKIIGNQKLHQEMIKNSFYEAGLHTWDHAAKEVMEKMYLAALNKQ